MAIYHFHDSVISRGKGQSIVAASAYQSRGSLYNERDGETKDYSHKVGQDLLFSGVYVPKDAPDWARTPEGLWNGVERAEDQHNKTRKASATLAHNIDLALMAELTPEQNRYALQDFLRETYVRAGYGVQASIHGHEEGGDARNIHAHLLVSLRTLNGEGFSPEKQRTDRRQMKEQVCQWREAWARTAARHLRRHGQEQAAARMEVGHLTLAEQRAKAIERGDMEHAEALDREATQHLGAKAARMERDGLESERGAVNREIREEAHRRQRDKAEKAEIAREIERLEAEERQRQAEEQRKAAEIEAQRQEEARKQAEELEAARAFEAMMREIREEEQARKAAQEAEQAQAFARMREQWEIRAKPEQQPQPAPAEDWNKLRVPSRTERPASIEETRPPTAELWKADRLHRARQEPQTGQPAPTPSPTNENRPQSAPEKPPQATQRPAEANPRSHTARAFNQAQQGEKPPQPEPPRRRTEQREAFNEAARAPEEQEKAQETRSQGESGSESQTQANRPANQNKRRPRAQTAEEMRERMKNRSGMKRTRERE